MKRTILPVLASVISLAACNQLLGLEVFTNECGGPLDSPADCATGGAGGRAPASSSSGSTVTSSTGRGGATASTTSSAMTSSSSLSGGGGSSVGGAAGTGGAATAGGGSGAGGLPDHCTDHARDDGETDIDCGGGECPPCTDGEGCENGADCTSLSCPARTCVPPSCTDQIKNGNETAVDCGGTDACPRCALTKACKVDADCVGVGPNRCDATHVCVPTCTDGIQDGNELGIDCGGGTCPGCAVGGACTTGADCATGLCEHSACATVVSVSAGNDGHACAVTAGGAVRCWGENGFGQLGTGATSGDVLKPVAAAVASGATFVSAGAGITCALINGVVDCWGRDDLGQVGNGTMQPQVLTPALVVGLGAVTSLSSFGGGGCAVVAGGAVKCWGDNTFSELGVPGGASATPVTVTNLSSGADRVSTSGISACAHISATNAVMCWGAGGAGQLGNGAMPMQTSTPVMVGNGYRGGVTVGDNFACGVEATGSVFCWGNNGDGELGNGNTTSSNLPVLVSNSFSKAHSLSSGGEFTCVVVSGSVGALKCWGSNFAGGLGDGTTNSSSVPVDVMGLTSGVGLVSAGEGFACAVTLAGAVKCWGLNSHGQLGDGTTMDRHTPVDVVFP